MGATLPIAGPIPAFGLEVVLTAILMFVILACAVGQVMTSFPVGRTVGTTVALCALMGGPLSGASMNPARSLGPALVSGNLTAHWIYWLAPAIGAGLAVLLYRFIWAETTVPAP